jgi:hypothetical protein
VHAIVTDEFAGGQAQTLHFHYLRASNGGLVLEANGLEAHAVQLAATLRGEGVGGEQARRFVSDFVRPRGIDAPVAPLMVEELERAARIGKRPRRQPLWQRAAGGAVRWALRSRRALSGRRAEVRA